ncbi:hypothetical protein A2U01_0055496, partial [Trifolium medium]|nr:hypothetical protein [Trifolium medium]
MKHELGPQYGKNFGMKFAKKWMQKGSNRKQKGSNRWNNMLHNFLSLNGKRLWHRWRRRGRDRNKVRMIIQDSILNLNNIPVLHKVMPVKDI